MLHGQNPSCADCTGLNSFQVATVMRVQAPLIEAHAAMGMQASRLGVEIPQMGLIAAALAALQWTARVSAALGSSCCPQPSAILSPSPPSLASPILRPDSSPASSPNSPATMPEHAPATETPSEQLLQQHSLAGACERLDETGSSPLPGGASRLESIAAQPASSTDMQAHGTPQRARPMQPEAEPLRLADAEGLLEEGRALPVAMHLLEDLSTSVRTAQQWEACLVALVGLNKVQSCCLAACHALGVARVSRLQQLASVCRACNTARCLRAEQIACCSRVWGC